eukprot:3419449-Pyramimonas_sp.AAC.1
MQCKTYVNICTLLKRHIYPTGMDSLHALRLSLSAPSGPTVVYTARTATRSSSAFAKPSQVVPLCCKRANVPQHPRQHQAPSSGGVGLSLRQSQ